MLQLIYTMFSWYPVRSLVGGCFLLGLLFIWVYTCRFVCSRVSKTECLLDLLFGIYLLLRTRY